MNTITSTCTGLITKKRNKHEQKRENFFTPQKISSQLHPLLIIIFLFPIILTEHGNPGGLPGLYSGSVADFTKADSVIFRTDLYNQTTGTLVHPFKRTIKYDSKWLDSKLLYF